MTPSRDATRSSRCTTSRLVPKFSSLKRGEVRLKSVSVEGRSVCDRPRQHPSHDRAVSDEPDAKFAKCLQQTVLRVPGEQRVLVLRGDHRVDRVGPANGRRRRLGDAQMQDLSLLDELVHRAPRLFYGQGGVHPVLVVEVDVVDPEPSERGVATGPARTRGGRSPRPKLPSARRSLPNFVAMTNSSRLPGSPGRPAAR